MVGIPAGPRGTTVHWAVNLACQVWPLNTSLRYCVPEGLDTSRACNAIAEEALQVGAPYVWLVEDDTLPPNYAVQRLMGAMVDRQEVMACAGIYYSKSDTPQPVVYAGPGAGPYWEWKRGEPFELPSEGFIGTGCMLIKTEVFTKLERPYFKNVDYPRTSGDAYFCGQVHAAGYKILGHGGVQCGHYDKQAQRVVWPPGATRTVDSLEEAPQVIDTPPEVIEA